MSDLDRIIRLIVTAAIAVLYFTGVISSALAIVLGVIAVIFLITQPDWLMPAVQVFGISTAKKAS